MGDHGFRMDFSWGGTDQGKTEATMPALAVLSPQQFRTQHPDKAQEQNFINLNCQQYTYALFSYSISHHFIKYIFFMFFARASEKQVAMPCTALDTQALAGSRERHGDSRKSREAAEPVIPWKITCRKNRDKSETKWNECEHKLERPKNAKGLQIRKKTLLAIQSTG